MGQPNRKQELDDALASIEESILPGISMMLDTLLDAATLGRPGFDAEAYAAELRTIALQLETLTRQVEAISPTHIEPMDYRASSVA